jgi:hypothetical protein
MSSARQRRRAKLIYPVLWAVYLLAACLTSVYVRRSATSGLPDSFASYLCSMNSSTHSGSTARDAVLLYASYFAAGLELCVRSLRSAGANCRIVLFVGPDFAPPRRFLPLAEHLRIEVVPNCSERRGREFVPHMLRFEYELEWLEANRGAVDRVFHTDSFDVFFQGDPFASHVSADALRFVIEPHQIRSCGWNLGWMIECYGSHVLERMRHRFIACSGSIAGGAGHYTRLVLLMIAQSQWKTCWKASMDQPILNYLLWSGMIDQANISYSLTGCHEGFFTVQWCVVERNVRYNEHGQVVSTMDTVPSYIHQYNRLQDLSNHFYDSCRMGRQKAS